MTNSSVATTRGHAASSAIASQRQWQREQTMVGIVRSGLAVLIVEGYAATTAERMAEAAGVSVRTLFRYFPSGKDDVILVVARRSLDLLEESIRSRPATESLTVALGRARATWLERLELTAAASPSIPAADGMRLAAQIADEQPDLLARMLGERQMLAERLVDDFSMRLGLDPAKDMRPRVFAHCYVAALVSGYMAGIRLSVDSNALVDEALELIRPLLSSWP